MKDKIRFTIWGKIIAFLLFFMGLFCIPAGGIGTYYMINEGYYIANAQSLKNKYLDSYLYEVGRQILYQYHEYGKEEADRVAEGVSIKYYVIDTNEWWNSQQNVTDAEWENTYRYTSGKNEYYFHNIQNQAIKIIVPKQKEYPDYVALVCYMANHADVLKVLFPMMLIGGLVLVVCGTMYLLCGAGWSAKEKEQTEGAFGFIPIEVLVLFLVAYIIWLFRQIHFSLQEYMGLIYCAAFGIGIAVPLLATLVSVAARVKAGTLWKKSVIGRIGRVLGACLGVICNIFMKLPMIWKTAVIALVIILLELVVLIFVYHNFSHEYYLQRTFQKVFVLWMLEKVFLMIGGFFCVQRLKELQLAGKELAAGNSDYKVDTGLMFGALKEYAENLNSISKGVAKAVEEKMKSEHFKTELITNVSHDIKTPLTSIINYSDLIRKEKTENTNIIEYSEVLYRQSCRLKKLIDDLMEASKASTGNIEVTSENIDVGVLLVQAAGEYEQRFLESELEVVSRQPEEPVIISADSKLLWRVFDNLLTNICKYSHNGTRVYLVLEKNGKDAMISFKNISKYPLEISAEELMERFVRGDRARHTEGNGLGLNIAKSLTELQNGILDIVVDGDLFKVLLTFPLIEEMKE